MMARVKLERQVVLDGKLDAARPAPVAQGKSGRLLLATGKSGGECACRLRLRPLLPTEGARVRVLSLDGDREGRVALKDRGQRLAQIVEPSNLDTGLLLDLLDLDVTAGEGGPGEVVQKEVRTGRIRLARPLKVIDLDVIEAGDLAQQPQPLTRLPKLL